MALPVQSVICASALLLNADRHILFQQRDNTPTIHFPNYWALLGGHVEPDETPDQAVARELCEEIEYTGHLFWWKAYDFWRSPDVLVHQHLYFGAIDSALEDIPFHEGQALRFFNRADLDLYPIAFGFDELCKSFLLCPPPFETKPEKGMPT